MILVCQDECQFDTVDVEGMISLSQTPSIGIVRPYKMRLTQKSGGLAIAESTGLYFATYANNNAGQYEVTLTDEVYCKQTNVNDFIEFKRDTFFVTIIEVDYFAIVKRRTGSGGIFNSGNVTKIRTINPSCLTMGMDLIQGPHLDDTLILVRDRRGVQMVNL